MLETLTRDVKGDAPLGFKLGLATPSRYLLHRFVLARLEFPWSG